MAEVHLRPVTQANFDECVGLAVAANQRNFVAPNMNSLAEAYVNSTLQPWAIYDTSVRGYEQPNQPMLGFVMVEISNGIGFIARLMIDERYQRRGYGRTAMLEIIRRLKLMPEVEISTVSYLKQNLVAAWLYRSLGFVPWDVDWAKNHPIDIYVKLEI